MPSIVGPNHIDARSPSTLRLSAGLGVPQLWALGSLHRGQSYANMSAVLVTATPTVRTSLTSYDSCRAT